MTSPDFTDDKTLEALRILAEEVLAVQKEKPGLTIEDAILVVIRTRTNQ